MANYDTNFKNFQQKFFLLEYPPKEHDLCVLRIHALFVYTSSCTSLKHARMY